eukprot:2557859-Amphidinium_carterae.1
MTSAVLHRQRTTLPSVSWLFADRTALAVLRVVAAASRACPFVSSGGYLPVPQHNRKDSEGPTARIQ